MKNNWRSKRGCEWRVRRMGWVQLAESLVMILSFGYLSPKWSVLFARRLSRQLMNANVLVVEAKEESR